MIDGICADLPLQKKEADEAIQEKRWKDAARQAHSLKTSAGYLSAESLVLQLKGVEKGLMIPEQRKDAIVLWKLVKKRLADFKNELSRVEIEASDT
jgi:HPt (histidine-containing phosphotransfer) domain-containing protein